MARRRIDLAARNRIIARLFLSGETAATLAILTGLHRRRVERIAHETALPLPPSAAPLPTLHELGQLRREHRLNPTALEWLAAQRLDRRRNGRSYPC